jgi:hypothetical protein
MLTTSRIIDELTAFNQTQGTSFSIQDLRKFNYYKDHYGMDTEDAFNYIQTCHSCESQLETFAGEYCCFTCFNKVEELLEPCFRGADCLICHRPPIMPPDAILVDEMECNYTSYEDIKLALCGYVGVTARQVLPESFIAKVEDWWFVIKPIENDDYKFNVAMYSCVPTTYLEREFDMFVYYLREYEIP